MDNGEAKKLLEEASRRLKESTEYKYHVTREIEEFIKDIKGSIRRLEFNLNLHMNRLSTADKQIEKAKEDIKKALELL